MATVRTNPLVNGLSGMLGSIVFKNYGGNTIITSKPSLPKTQSTQQKANRSKFREATAWAKNALLDPVKKEYYLRKAKKLRLPNAYTAAITDYMRPPKITSRIAHDKSVIYTINKKDFDVKGVTLLLHDGTGTIAETRMITKDKYNEWSFKVSENELLNGIDIRVINEAGKIYLLKTEV